MNHAEASVIRADELQMRPVDPALAAQARAVLSVPAPSEPKRIGRPPGVKTLHNASSKGKARANRKLLKNLAALASKGPAV